MSKNPTITALVAAAVAIVPSFTEDQAKKLINEHKARSFKKITELFTPLIPVEVKAEKKVKTEKSARIRTVRTVTPGPRGFRFGDKWMDSVRSATGIAVHPTHFNKLKAQASALGIPADGVDAVSLAKAIAKAPAPAASVSA